ncbi:hypothetical protein PPL_11973 [Heterostelium album PN500]|uniref:Ankyrin repeat protein n=1 Tax=Heterostelium pallidum (strain ATCC 26659 / Pp 5 / PN500) TaxID=670386 RepID=D3BV01_HETP5|nr:hypothetical protein PPL_11973 [Heterostelium album PN500]EFA74939.1 hypothetical protein PPL_11973 [Heterostelium album PN500]|eukprot:XP_020427073.1 hypothetical protein PPL_11973 [Heterostelium album PN500]
MMDKSIFSLVFNNKVLCNNIFNHVILISSSDKRKHFKWSEVVVNAKVLAAHNYFEQLKQFLSKIVIKDPIVKNSILMIAIKYGDIDMLAYLMNRFKVDLNSVDNSFSNYLKSNINNQEYNEPCCYLNSIYCYAAQKGRMDIVDYLTARFKSYQWNYYRAMVKSPLSKNLEIVKYFVDKHNNNTPPTKFKVNRDLGVNVFDTAAYVGQIEMIEYLVRERPNDLQNSKMYLYAIEGGNTHFIEYLLREHRDLANKERQLIDSASSLYRFDIVKLLFSNGISECTSKPIDNAAIKGDMEMLIWLKENTTAESTKHTMDYAAMNGHLDCLKWLNANITSGCSSSTMDYASMSHLLCVKWLHYNRTEGCTTQSIENATQRGNLEILQWINSNYRSLKISRSCVWQAIEYSGKLQVFQWIYENTTHEYTYFSLIEMASHFNRFNILKYLIQQNNGECHIQY